MMPADDPAVVGQLDADRVRLPPDDAGDQLYRAVLTRLRDGSARRVLGHRGAEVHEHLLELHRQLVDERLQYRLQTWQRIADAMERLRAADGTTDLLAKAGPALRWCIGTDRLTASAIRGAALHPMSVYWPGDERRAEELRSRLASDPPQLDQRLIETDVVRRGSPRLVTGALGHPRLSESAQRVVQSNAFMVAPLRVDQRTVGLVFGDYDLQGRPVDAIDAEGFNAFVQQLSHVIERSVLRDQLLTQADALTRLAGVTPSPFDMGPPSGASPVPAGSPARPPGGRSGQLTRRETEVLRLMAEGCSNLSIAAQLVVTEAAVKFHVKNILRKLSARNRAEAVARYLRTTSGGGEP